MATLRQIQKTELEILKEIDRVCRENGIRYSLAWGTMLGAVRHRGFIPWDDDADVYMLESDLNTLMKQLNKQDFFFQSNVTDPESPYTFYKIRKNRTVMSEELTKCLNMHQGVWVDVFTPFPAGNREWKRKTQYKLSQIWHSYRCRYINMHGKRKKIRAVFMCSMPLKVNRAIDRLLHELIYLLGDNNSDEYFFADDGKYETAFVPKHFFRDFTEYEFEGTKLFGIKDYDEYLTYCYGSDYMIPQKYTHDVDYSNVVLTDNH